MMRPTLTTTRPTILVAEDDADSRDMMRVLLELRGFSVVTAADGQEAVEAAERERPDLILMDLQLPRLNGFAVARRLRQGGDGTRDVPIVIVSGHDPNRHRPLALAAGCDEYLLKPLDFDLLERTLARLLPRFSLQV